MPSCREVTELVTDYLEGRMSFAERIRFRVHLGTCAHCRAYVDQMRKTVKTARKLDEPLPPEIRDELVHAFRDWKTRAH